MTFLKKALTDTIEPDPRDAAFEDYAVKTVANGTLTSLQKKVILKGMLEIAEGDYQRMIAENYYRTIHAITNGDGQRADPATLEKASTMLLSAMVLLKTAERKRKNKK